MIPPGRRWPRAVRVLLLTTALGAAAAPASAEVADYLGRTVTQVRFEYEGASLTDAALSALVETRVGRPLRPDEVRRTIDRLFDLGRYEDIRVRASLEGGGVVLVYELVPVHRVQALEFLGRGDVDESRLRAAVIDRLGPTPLVGRAADAARILEDLYRDEGYRQAVVMVRSRIERDPDRAILVFDIAPGPATRIGEIAVEGAGVVPAVVIGQLDLRPNQPFRRVALDEALARFRADLQARGYYNARVNYLPRFAPDETTVDVTVIVDTGSLVRLRVEGDRLPEAELDTLVPIARERSADEDLLEDSKRRIEGRLRAQGFRDALAEYRREGDDEVLTVVFTITRGSLYRLDRVELTGSEIAAELEGLLRLVEGEPFVDDVLSADVAAMEELYRRRGYADARIAATVSSEDVAPGSRAVTVVLDVVEGPQAVIGDIRFTGARALDDPALRAVVGLTPGQVFYAPDTIRAADALVTEYANRGYQNAQVLRLLTFSDDRGTVDVDFEVSEGIQIVVDEILISGNTRTRVDVIERELVFAPGEPLGRSALVESQRRLGALGLFRRIQIAPIGQPGDDGRQDVLVTIEEGPATTLSWGGGPEGGQRLRRSADGTGIARERFEFGARGFVEIGRRNLWGKNRSVNLFARVSARPRGESVVPEGASVVSNRSGFNEYRALLTYREPRILGTTADGQLAGVLEQGIRSSFNFSRRLLSFEVGRRLSPGTSLNGGYSLEQTRLFDEQPNDEDKPLIDRLFPQVRLSSLTSTFVRDTRGDPIEPVRGMFTTVDAELAVRAIGSEVGFAKALVKAFLYRRLSSSGRVVLAGGSTIGLANGFPREARIAGRIETIEELPASERFYAGGDTTVRGFALDSLGTRKTIDENGFPTGGHALVIFNTELRTRVWGDLGAVGFLDVGNVFASVSEVDPALLRGSVGVGLRYSSPIGPIRVDLGFKLSRFEFRTGRLLADGSPETRLEPLTALHISLGQAF